MKVFDILKEKLKKEGVSFKKIELSEPPRSAKDVERLFGCSLNQVLKAIVLVGKEEPVLAILPGDKRVDFQKLKEITGIHELRMASPDEITEITGYQLGGVCPFFLKNKIKKVMDKKVFEIKIVNIGGGIPILGVELKAKDLKRIWDGLIADISQ